MKIKALPLCLFSVLTCGGLLSTSAQATTNLLDLTVTTNVKTGTCNAAMQNTGGSSITQVVFTGPIYTNDVKNGNKSELFQIALTGCAGIPLHSAYISVQPAAGASCDNNGAGPYFANKNTVASGGANAVAVKVGLTHTPSTGLMLGCNPKTEGYADLNQNWVEAKKGRVIHLYATLLRDTGKADADLTAGTFSAPTVFDIRYE
ncbi:MULTISPECIES: hypothetical protein [Escherichia]|uniref:hypothetical protein n=1 Tax=Escherichia TaxID=561 RepID=UPI0007E461A9|nr:MULTISPECIES: hypothetical protein [Escherichia]MEC9497279.1 fimbrial protein [Escherichia whittamii]MEC9558929.1 fimbrial protein [Escherichia whittamii]QLX43302.1 fimbrial protein [Escherichia coli]